MNTTTERAIEYHAMPYGKICTIPAGTKVVPASNLPGHYFWAEPWAGMSDKADSWNRNYGFMLEPSDLLDATAHAKLQTRLDGCIDWSDAYSDPEIQGAG